MISGSGALRAAVIHKCPAPRPHLISDYLGTCTAGISAGNQILAEFRRRTGFETILDRVSEDRRFPVEAFLRIDIRKPISDPNLLCAALWLIALVPLYRRRTQGISPRLPEIQALWEFARRIEIVAERDLYVTGKMGASWYWPNDEVDAGWSYWDEYRAAYAAEWAAHPELK